MSDVNEAITEHAAGAVLAVVVAPRAGKTEFDRIEGGAVRVRVAAPPVDGAANTALLRFLADAFERPKSSVRLLTGATGRRKRILISGLSRTEVAAQVAQLLRDGATS